MGVRRMAIISAYTVCHQDAVVGTAGGSNLRTQGNLENNMWSDPQRLASGRVMQGLVGIVLPPRTAQNALTTVGQHPKFRASSSAYSHIHPGPLTGSSRQAT